MQLQGFEMKDYFSLLLDGRYSRRGMIAAMSTLITLGLAGCGSYEADDLDATLKGTITWYTKSGTSREVDLSQCKTSQRDTDGIEGEGLDIAFTATCEEILIYIWYNAESYASRLDIAGDLYFTNKEIREPQCDRANNLFPHSEYVSVDKSGLYEPPWTISVNRAHVINHSPRASRSSSTFESTSCASATFTFHVKPKD